MKHVRDTIITYIQVNKNLKNIRKFPKHSLTNKFVRTLNTYSKEHNRFQTMSHPFKRPVTIFGCFEGKKIVKTEYDHRNISKWDKNNLTNNIKKLNLTIKTLHIYFK